MKLFSSIIGFALACVVTSMVLPRGASAASNDLFAVTPEQAASSLEEYFQKASADIAACRVREARQELSMIGYKILKYKNMISRDDKKKYDQRVASVNASVKQLVDSLVKVNLSIVAKKGRSAGNEFRQYLSQQQGLSESELASIDEAILESPASEEGAPSSVSEYAQATTSPPPQPPTPPPSPQPSAPLSPPSAQPLPKSTPEMQPTIASPTPKPEPLSQPPSVQPSLLPSVSSQPVQQPIAETSQLPIKSSANPESNGPLGKDQENAASQQEKSPKIEAIAEQGQDFDKSKARAADMAAKVGRLLSEGRTDEALTVFQIYQASFERFLSQSSFADLKTAVESADNRERNGRGHAQSQRQKIEQLLDNDRVLEASSELNGSRDELHRYLEGKEYEDLNSRVVRAVVDFNKAQASVRALARQIRTLIDAKKVEDAFVKFDKSRSELRRYLPKEEMDGLNKDIAAAHDALQDKKRLAELSERDIISLVKADKTAEAQDRLTQDQSMLRQYLDAKRFSSLQSTVADANKESWLRRQRAASVLARVDSLIGKSRIEEAHDLFVKEESRIKRDLGDEGRFIQTKDRVEKEYGLFISQKAIAMQSLKKARYLIDHREGRKADSLVRLETQLLARYASPNDFEKLKREAAHAKADYETGYSKMRSTTATLKALLDKKKVEQAFRVFHDAEDDLDFYFGDDGAVLELVKRVKDANAALKDRKQWASSQVRQIERLIDKNRGDQAYAQFHAQQAELTELLDTKTITSLDSSVNKANRTYVSSVARAEKSAANIRSLIARSDVEGAYAAFDTAESDLQFYLDPAIFSALKTTVEKLNGVLQDNRRDALRCAASIDRLIDRNRGDSAYALFHQKDIFLSKYLKAQTYKSEAARAGRAKADYEKNCKLALAIVDKLKSMVNLDHEEAAYKEFDGKRNFLQQYLDNVTYSRAETMVRVPWEFFLQNRKKMRTCATLIRRMIGRNQAIDARDECNGRDRDLARYLPKDEYAELKKDVALAYERSVKGRRDAAVAAQKIRDLLTRDKTSEAYASFRDARSTLETYSEKSDFTRLQTEVAGAYDDLEMKKKQAKDYAKKLKQLVAKSKMSDAYRDFNQNRKALKDYLDADVFADLETTVDGAYEKVKEKSKTSHPAQ